MRQLEFWPQHTRPNILQYVAGILDGEGSFIIRRSDVKRRTIYYCAKVQVDSTNENLPALLQKLFRGSFGLVRPPKGKHKAQYRWAVSGQDSASVCRLVLPYLCIKRLNAENVLDFQDYYQSIPSIRWGSKKARHPTARFTRKQLFDLNTFVIRSQELNS